MQSLLTYNLRVAVVMAVFYLFYRLLLSRETFHRLNRVVLLATALLSFVLPLCIITITRTVEVGSFEIDSLGTATDANLYITTQRIAESASLHLIIALIFGVGVLAVLAWNVASIISLRRLIKSGRPAELYGEEVTVVEQKIAPFSWFRHIVLSEQDAEECGEMVVAHEKAHIALRHSWDLAIVNLCCAVQWFNPAMWLLRSDLKDIHEFEADAEVLRSGIDARSYQILLIKKTVGNKSYSIANSLNHSTLKKRITMMLSKKSSAGSRWKLLYTLPVVALSLTAFAEQRTNLVVIDDSDNKVTQKTETSQSYLVISEQDGRDTTKMDVRLSLRVTGGDLEGVENVVSGMISSVGSIELREAGEDFTIFGPEGSAVVFIDKEGNYQFNGAPSTLEAIGTQLSKWRGTDKEPKSIIISISKDSPSGYTDALKEVLRANGQLRISTIYQEDVTISFDGDKDASYKMTIVGDAMDKSVPQSTMEVRGVPTDAVISVRGVEQSSVEPLCIVKNSDGALSKGKMEEISPNDIKSVSILKDDQAEPYKQYGDTSNGVILIELK